MAGFVGVTELNRFDNFSEVDLGGGVSAGCLRWAVGEARDRGAGASGVPAWDDLLRDFMGHNAGQVDVLEPWFEVRGLAAGTYEITFLTGDPSFPAPDEHILLNGVDIDLTEWDGGTQTFPDDWATTVSITLAAGEAITLGRPAVGQGKLAGMLITPEPVTFALLAFGGLVAVRRRK
jgi:hypothetical protein